ncbi:MAG: RNA polymerase sigma factor [Clostridia bacterium]|nr:RNA polymerase sigma factor [Clostridia bacterium]
MNDKKLARQLTQSNESAFGQLIDEYTAYVSTIAYNIAGDRLAKTDIEEIVTDVFLTVWKNSKNLKENNLKGYISCITKCRTKYRLRKEKPAEIISIDDIEQSDSTKLDEGYEQKELCRSLREEIDRLKEPDREILLRYYYYYQTTAEIAEVLGIKVETIKTKLARSRQKLKVALTERGF